MIQEMLAAVQLPHSGVVLQYMCQADPVAAWLRTSALIWVRRSLIREGLAVSIGNATVSATHSARLTQLLPVVIETLRLPAP